LIKSDTKDTKNCCKLLQKTKFLFTKESRKTFIMVLYKNIKQHNCFK